MRCAWSRVQAPFGGCTFKVRSKRTTDLRCRCAATLRSRSIFVRCGGTRFLRNRELPHLWKTSCWRRASMRRGLWCCWTVSDVLWGRGDCCLALLGYLGGGLGKSKLLGPLDRRREDPARCCRSARLLRAFLQICGRLARASLALGRANLRGLATSLLVVRVGPRIIASQRSPVILWFSFFGVRLAKRSMCRCLTGLLLGKAWKRLSIGCRTTAGFLAHICWLCLWGTRGC